MTIDADYGRGPFAHERARRLIGQRVRWQDETFGGTVTDTTRTRNGYPMLIVKWDAEAPEWWGTEVSPCNKSLIFSLPPDDGSETR